MAKAAFLYLTGEEQEAGLAAVLQASWSWLAAEGKTGQEVRAILESPEAVDFRWLKSSDEVKGWPIGRAFGRRGELTWRREDGLTHAVLITDRDDVPPAFADARVSPGGKPAILSLSPINDERLPEEVRLWGERHEDGTWREARIPGPLSYPVREKEVRRRMMLSVRRYVIADAPDQPDTGLADFVRYVDLTS
ncbi:MAG: hypothetical protein QHJ81_14620 [Anaerolineae bacterium]|nr:hypothetical protein [Anaerolineae bacterium]